MLEPERYELAEGPLYSFDLDRRDFFRTLGAGLLVLCVVDSAEAQESGGGGRRRGRPAMPQDLGAWLHIGDDGKITGFSGKAEVGQNTRTVLTQAIAEELYVPIASVTMVMADTDRVPWDAGTFGSRSMPDMLPQIRRVAATAREALIDRAAAVLSADRASLKAGDGRIGGKTYAELVRGQNLLKTTQVASPALIPPHQWQRAGKVNAAEFVTGAHKYSSDVKLPGMLYGAVVRPPAVGATLAGADVTDATRLEGVRVVQDGGFLGVAAPDRATLRKAVAAVKPEWKTTAQPSEAELFTIFKNKAKPRPESTKGDVEQGLASAAKTLDGTYTVAYIAHAPLEPRSAVAEWVDGKLTVWTGTQRPFGVRSELATAFNIPEEKVRVIVPDTGSGYGGKHTGEAAVEAARLARDAGKPVRVVWTREEEFTHAYFRPAGLIEVKSGFGEDGRITAWDFHNYNSGGSGIAALYDIPHQRVHYHSTESPLRQGSYRALAATANHFARETHIDEIAHLLRQDPLDLRLKNLTDPRLRTVFEKAAEAFGWAKRKSGAGVGFGIGGGFEKGGYVATVAEVAADKDLKQVRVVRLVTAFECGAVVNPDCLRNQIEGGVVQGLGGALTEAIHFENGRILNPRFSKYRVPRFRDTPVIETVLVDRRDLPPAGAGEAPIVGTAPAIGNAIFDATGKRLRSMPLLG